MWFSYPREESWIPLPLNRVKEIQQMNRDGVIPADLGEVVEEETKPVKALDYENVVGQDSLTRLDDRRGGGNKKKNKNNRNKNQRPNGPSTDSNRDQQRPVTTSPHGQMQARPQGPRLEGQGPGPDGSNNNRDRNSRNNRNNQNRQGGNNPNGNRENRGRDNGNLGNNNNPDGNRDNGQ